jgi:hypothetical protein
MTLILNTAHGGTIYDKKCIESVIFPLIITRGQNNKHTLHRLQDHEDIIQMEHHEKNSKKNKVCRCFKQILKCT